MFTTALIFTGLLLVGVSFFVPDGTSEIIVVSLSSFLLAWYCVRLTSFLDQRYIVYKFFVFFHLLQPLLLLIYVVLYPYQVESAVVNTTLYSGGAYTLYYSFLIVPLLGLFVAIVNKSLSGGARELGIEVYSRAAGHRLDFILIVSAFSVLSSWFILGIPGAPGYVLRVFRASLAFTPFLAGLYYGRSLVVRYVWFIVLGLGLFFAIITGSRGYAFWPLLMYVLGVLFQLKPKRIQLAGWCLFALSIPVGIFVIGFIQQLRSEVGRTSLRETNISEVVSFIPTALENTLSRGDEVYLADESTGSSTGFSRLVDWTLLFAPNMSPNPAEYRGYGDYHKELLSLFSFGGTNLDSKIGSFYPSFMYARMYGFNVYGGADEKGLQQSFTVPFAVVADSWSRGGLPSTVFQVLMMLWFFVVAEALNRRWFRRYPEVMVLLFFHLCDTALRFATVYTVTRSIRNAILYGALTGVVVFGIRFVRKNILSSLFVPRD